MKNTKLKTIAFIIGLCSASFNGYCQWVDAYGYVVEDVNEPVTTQGRLGIGSAASSSYSLDVYGAANIRGDINTSGSLNMQNTYYNVFIGYNPGSSISGAYNVGIGYQVLHNNGSAECNALGYKSLYNNYSGQFNDAMGYEALYGNTSGNYNSGFGTNAGGQNSTGSYNVSMGYLANYHNTASNNSGIGFEALANSTSGGSNTGVGFQSGYTNTTGANNTYIGYTADATANNWSNSTAIGYQAQVNNSNDIRLGNASIATLRCNVTTITTSDARVKDNIKENVPGIAFIKLLKPVTYHLNVDKQNAIVLPHSDKKDSTGNQKSDNFPGKYDVEKIQFTGFIAQDVEKAAKQVGYDFSGLHKPKDDKDIYGIAYSDFVAPIVKALQEQQQIIEKQDSINKAMQAQINQLTAALSANNNVNTTSINTYNIELTDVVVLNQNQPNPFAEQTTITYSIPHGANNAQMLFYDTNGKQVNTINLSGKGKGQLNVYAADLSSGTYSYTLVVDGKVVDTKKMIKQ